MHCVLLYHFNIFLKHGNILLMDTLLKNGIFLLLSKQINQVSYLSNFNIISKFFDTGYVSKEYYCLKLLDVRRECHRSVVVEVSAVLF